MNQGATTRPHAAAICTGGKRIRDATHILHMRHRLGADGAGLVGDELTAGGPLDAPDLMPAGACTNADWTDGAGQPITSATQARRA